MIRATGPDLSAARSLSTVPSPAVARPSSKRACAEGEACARTLPNRLVTTVLIVGTALAIAAFGAALGQGKAVASAAEAIARNPGAAGEIRGSLILGLVLIESLVIYVLLISLILFFLKPFGG